MRRFNDCLGHVLESEGGFVDHPADPGGATNMGITHRTLAAWRGVEPWWLLDKHDVRALTRGEAARIYEARYWKPGGADRVPAGVDLALFDFAVHSGPPKAVNVLQAIVGVPRDGIFGPVTETGVRTWCEANGARALIKRLCEARLDFLKRLRTFDRFGNGWSRRLARVRRDALAVADHSNPNEKGINDMNILSGYKTYIVAAAMLVAGLAQLAGVDLPGFETQSTIQLIMEALAVLFLRKGVKQAGNPG